MAGSHNVICMTTMVAVLLQDMYDRVCVATIRLLLPWFDMPSERWNNSKLKWYIVVAVNLNIIVNQAVLLMISISIFAICVVGLSAKPFIWGNLHRLSMALKIRTKLCMRGSSRRVVLVCPMTIHSPYNRTKYVQPHRHIRLQPFVHREDRLMPSDSTVCGIDTTMMRCCCCWTNCFQHYRGLQFVIIVVLLSIVHRPLLTYPHLIIIVVIIIVVDHPVS